MDNDAFTSFKTRLQASLANQEANPMTALQDTLQKALYMVHPRTILSLIHIYRFVQSQLEYADKVFQILINIRQIF